MNTENKPEESQDIPQAQSAEEHSEAVKTEDSQAESAMEETTEAKPEEEPAAEESVQEVVAEAASDAVSPDQDPFLIPEDIVEPENPLPDAKLEDLSENIQSALVTLGWENLMPVQRKAIPYMRSGRDMLIQSKTGSGKTGAFVIPLLEIIEVEHCFPQSLILVPTRELATQVAGEVEKLAAGSGIKSVAIFGGVGYEPQIRALREGVHVVIATPGRLIDHLEKRNLDFNSLRDLVLDEADEMLSMGFYPDIQRIKRYLPRQYCTTMFSATIPQNVRSLAREFQASNAGFLSLSYRKVDAQNLDHVYHVVDAMEKDTAVLNILERENPESCIIFCNMKKDVHYLNEFLNAYGFNTGALSGDISQKHRDQILQQFRGRKLAILIATDVAARGIDISHVSHVIIHDHPDDHEVYIHRAGRTARAGRSGLAISIVTAVEERELMQTAADFGIRFQKQELPAREDIDNKIRQRCAEWLEREKRGLKKRAKTRLDRYLPLVDDLVAADEEKELLALLLDKFYWETLHKDGK